MKTTLVKESEIQRAWHILDATDKPVGRLAVQIAKLLRVQDARAFLFDAHADARVDADAGDQAPLRRGVAELGYFRDTRAAAKAGAAK